MIAIHPVTNVHLQLPTPSYRVRALVPEYVLNDTSAYKFAVFDLDGLQADAYAPKQLLADDYASLRSLLPAERCCYAVYNLTFICNMRPAVATIFYTWVPPAAPLDEQQRYLLQADSVAGRLSHHDFRVTSTQTCDFQQLPATSRARALLGHRRSKSPRCTSPAAGRNGDHAHAARGDRTGLFAH